ncbi:MAG: hypothetical protein VX733_13145 [Candidatus Latescibacterota bacterium]|nr:hypothetical protein [Candidatus Latescibacterota bacterium]
MLDEPYRWVEAIRNRREYLEDQLAAASAVVGKCYTDGILLLTTTPGPRKLFEAHNQVAFAGIGHPADIEKLRKAVIDIAHVEAFNLSASDVSLQRLVNFGVGPLMKGAFDEIFRSPLIARVLVAELDASDAQETFYTIDADGAFASASDAAVIAGSAEAAQTILDRLSRGSNDVDLQCAVHDSLRAWAVSRLVRPSAGVEEAAEESFSDSEIGEAVRNALAELRIEAAVLDRTLPTTTKFRLLPADELERLTEALR